MNAKMKGIIRRDNMISLRIRMDYFLLPYLAAISSANVRVDDIEN